MSIKVILLFFSSFYLLNTLNIEWLSETTYNFGDLEQGAPVECFFRFKNLSTDTLLIDNVRTTCGCTAPDWSVEPILPQAISEIRVVYDAKKSGYFRKKIKVFFNQQRKAEQLTIEGYVIPGL